MKKARSNLAVALVALWAMALPTALTAQVYTPVVPAFVPPAVYPDGVPGDSDPVVRPQRRALSPEVLSFRVDPARRQANLATYVRKVEAKDPASAAALRTLFGSTDLFATIDAVIRPLGLSSSNLADAYALWSIIAWEGARGVSGNPGRAMAQAVKQQAETALLTSPALARMTDAQKQEAAETYLIQALLITASVDGAQGDSQRLADVGKAVAQGAKAAGMDLSKVTLTEEGFVPATRKTIANDAAQDATPDGVAANEASSVSPLLYAGAGAGVVALIVWAARGRR